MLIIVAPLYIPLILKLGFDPICYGVLYTVTCQIAYLTPPFMSPRATRLALPWPET